MLDATPVTVASGLNPQDHEVVWDGTTFVVVWDGQSTPGVRAARVGSDGSVLDPTPILIAGGFSFLGGIASDGSGSMIAYQDPSGWRRLAPLDIGVVGTPIDVAFWQFSSPGTLSWSGSEYLVTASRFGRRVSGAGAVVGGQIDFGPGADVADAAWHGTHWVTLVRAGAGASVFGVSARIVTASGAVLAPVSIGSVPNGSVAVPYSSHPGIGMDIAAGPDNQLAIVTHRRDATVGEGTYQSHLRFFDSLPTVSVSPSNVNEGSSGTTNLTFTVRLTPPSNEVVTLSYTTIAGTTSAGDDYQTTSGSLTFQAGESTKTVAVPIVGDDDIEPHESFFLRLTNVTGATPGALDSSLAFIINDDFDSDGDGLVDGRDPDEIGEIVTALPRQSIGSGNRKAFLDRLDQIETLIVAGDLYDAIVELRSLRLRVDGCNGTTGQKSDKNDWITSCADQFAIRREIDALIVSLSA